MTDLQLKVQQALLDDPRTKEHGIQVFDNNGIITLNGVVPSHEVSGIAKSITEKVPGVFNVINSLDVHM